MIFKKSNFFICLSLCLCLIPSVGMLFGTQEAAANEILCGAPTVLSENGAFNLDVLDETEDYIADHFALRQQSARVWAELNATIFKSSVEPQVVLGKDGWLFFDKSLDDYTGDALTDEELSRIAKSLAAMQKELEAQGKTFIFTIAPNKNSLYPTYMPDYVPKRTEHSNAARLKAFLEQEGVRYVDLYEAFRSKSEPLYYETDSHWTEKGAALAADQLFAAAEIRSDFFHAEFIPGERHLGDLYEMLYPGSAANEASEELAAGFHFEHLNAPNGGNAITLRTVNASEPGKLFCWRDSFGISLYPYLAERFGEAVFSRSTNYDLSNADVQSSDVVILEIVERNICKLLDL